MKYKIFNAPFVIVVPSTSLTTEYMHLATQISTRYHSKTLGSARIIRDVDIRDGDAARYNMIVIGGPLVNLYTRQRVSEDAMTQFQEYGYRIGEGVYKDDGTGMFM